MKQNLPNHKFWTQSRLFLDTERYFTAAADSVSLELGHWSQWSACSASYGVGFQQREFNCTHSIEYCQQDAQSPQTKLCETPHVMSSMADNKLQGLFKEHKKDMALINHQIKELMVSSEIDCALYCQRLPQCSSINMWSEKVSAKKARNTQQTFRASLICELNNATADSKPDSVVFITGVNYYSRVSKHWRFWGELTTFKLIVGVRINELEQNKKHWFF